MLSLSLHYIISSLVQLKTGKLNELKYKLQNLLEFLSYKIIIPVV
jgi:hypothetical protein